LCVGIIIIFVIIITVSSFTVDDQSLSCSITSACLTNCLMRNGRGRIWLRSDLTGTDLSFLSLSLSLCSSHTRLQLPIPLTIPWIQQIELTADWKLHLAFYIMLLTYELLPSSGLFTEVL
jgi:hypothetical protein